MNAPKLPLLAVLAALFAPLLTSCHSAPTRLFTLYSVSPATVNTAYAGPPLRIDAVHFPPTLDHIEVVRDIAPGELALSDFDHWSAPLGEVARQALSADLVARLPPGKAIFPHLKKPDGALGVSVDVLDFKADRQGVYLQASWIVTATGQPSATGGGNVILRTASSNPDAAATARVLSDLIGQLADRIVAGL